MTRQQHLNAYLARVRARRFRPGAHDCALFVSGWVEQMTGHDHAAAFRGRYTKLDAGQDLLAAAGFEDHVALVASILTETLPSMAQTGDLAVVDDRALGIVASERVFVLRPDGLGHVSRRQAQRAFTV